MHDKRGLCRRVVSVRPSVCHVRTILSKMNKHIFNFFSTSGSHNTTKRYGSILKGTPSTASNPSLIDLEGHFRYFCLKINVAYFSGLWQKVQAI